MKYNEGYFNNADNTRIYHQSWSPESSAKAVILLVHGLGEHSGRYMNLVNGLVPRGYAIHGLDHIGHGKSDGHREYINHFEEYTDTLHHYSGLIRSQYPDIPAFLLGHSLGGLISVRYLVDYQDEFKGAILSAPAIKIPGHVSALTIALGRLLSIVFPKLGLLPINPAAISRDPEVVSAYLNDPLVFKDKTPARVAAEILRTMQYVAVRAGEIDIPMMILQGTADTIVDPTGAALLNNKLASEDKTLKVYDGLYHEVLNEPEHEMILTDVAAWLEERLIGERLHS